MRHRKRGRKLGMDSSARKAMFRNMVTSLMLHGQIKTTEARAKELRSYAERLISIGKRAPATSALESLSGDDLQRARAQRVAAIRRIRQVVMDDEAVTLLMGDYAERYRDRPGGYTRVLKLGRPRPGDNAPMAVIALVTEPCTPKPKRKDDKEIAETAAAPSEAPELSEEARAADADVETESFEAEGSAAPIEGAED